MGGQNQHLLCQFALECIYRNQHQHKDGRHACAGLGPHVCDQRPAVCHSVGRSPSHVSDARGVWQYKDWPCKALTCMLTTILVVRSGAVTRECTLEAWSAVLRSWWSVVWWVCKSGTEVGESVVVVYCGVYAGGGMVWWWSGCTAAMNCSMTLGDPCHPIRQPHQKGTEVWMQDWRHLQGIAALAANP